MALSVVPVTTDTITQADVDTLAANVAPEDRCDTQGRDWPLATWTQYALDVAGEGKRAFLIQDESGHTYGGLLLQRLSPTEIRVRGIMLPPGRIDEAITRLIAALKARGFTTIWGRVYGDRVRNRLAQIAGVTVNGKRLDAT